VTHADAMEVALEWELTRISGMPCGSLPEPSRDINQDGCIDVADLQLVVANYGTPSASSSLRPADELSGDGQRALEASTSATSLTFTVNSVGDEADVNIGNGICKTASGVCSLRAAINEANAHPGPDTIAFNIPGSGVQTIRLTKKLPTLNDETGPTTIDGYTQPGATPNTDALISNGMIQVQIAGNGESQFQGLPITSPGNVIRGLALYQLNRPLWIYGANADNNTIVGNFIGTDATGTYAAATEALAAHGIHIEQGASGNQIGGTAPADRNVISGNGRHGVGIWHVTSDANVIRNNLVGLSPDGTRRLSNRKHGLDVNYGSAHNILGGTGPGERNVVSGNEANGIEVSHDGTTTGNQVIGNYIGTDVTGTRALDYTYNTSHGIQMEDGPTNNMIAENVIGNNRRGGIAIFQTYTTGNQIYNNRIGVGLDGTPIPNGRFGVLINGSRSRVGPNNIIAYNQYAGIKIGDREDQADFNTITQNSIYDNGALGIELLPTGVNVNDPGDADSGPNEQLNFPELTSATPQAVSGTACNSCRIEVFLAAPDRTGYGEGKTFVGSAATDNGGTFTVLVSGVKAGNYVTATATDATGNSSEFSINFVVSN
jgi:CSLREA domain-containing protein